MLLRIAITNRSSQLSQSLYDPALHHMQVPARLNWGHSLVQRQHADPHDAGILHGAQHLEREAAGQLDDKVRERVHRKAEGGCGEVQVRPGRHEPERIDRLHGRPLHQQHTAGQPKTAGWRQVHQPLNCAHRFHEWEWAGG